MNKKFTIKLLQIFFGLSLLVFGLNGFFGFLPIPEREGFARIFMDTLHGSEYLIPTIACIQILAGAALISNSWTTLALILMLPVAFNILLFHLLHDRQSLAPAMAIWGLNLFLLASRISSIKPLFQR